MGREAWRHDRQARSLEPRRFAPPAYAFALGLIMAVQALDTVGSSGWYPHLNAGIIYALEKARGLNSCLP